jgi:DNA repair exonuclease SbcCD ATPase subunit
MSNKLMNPRTKLSALTALLLAACLLVSCSEMSKAKKLVEDGNDAVKESEQYAVEADAKLKELDRRREEFPGNREQLSAVSQEAIELLDKAAGRLREAALNYEAASRAKIDDKLREYLSLKSQEFTKHVEHLEAAREIPKSVMDTSVTDFSLLNERRYEIDQSIEKLKKEWEDLAVRAKKIQEENKEKFEP